MKLSLLRRMAAQPVAQQAARTVTPSELVKPWRKKNMLVGSVIGAFVVGVYTYTIAAVVQEDFSDVKPAIEGEAEK
eukprot:m.354026 g.354026  ORF g.354026 m.354026 type:complete len:76 (+) comp16898_c0_seq1:72-299(+)